MMRIALKITRAGLALTGGCHRWKETGCSEGCRRCDCGDDSQMGLLSQVKSPAPTHMLPQMRFQSQYNKGPSRTFAISGATRRSGARQGPFMVPVESLQLSPTVPKSE